MSSLVKIDTYKYTRDAVADRWYTLYGACSETEAKNMMINKLQHPDQCHYDYEDIWFYVSNDHISERRNVFNLIY